VAIEAGISHAAMPTAKASTAVKTCPTSMGRDQVARRHQYTTIRRVICGRAPSDNPAMRPQAMRFARAPRGAVVVAPSTSRNPTTNTMPNMSVSASPDWSQNSGDAP